MNMFNIKMASCIAPGNLITFEDPPWTYAERAVLDHFEHSGVIRLRVDGPGAQLLHTLEFESQPYRYLLTASLRRHLRGRPRMHVPSPASSDGKRLPFDERAWDSGWVLSDISVALRTFKEVFDTGTLCKETLANMRWQTRERP